MAHYRKRGRVWSVELYRHGVREHGTFRTKAEAVGWAHLRESELIGATLPNKTLDDALARFLSEKAPSLASPRWAETKIRNLRAYPIARKPLSILSAPDIAQWRDERLGGPRLKGKGSVMPSTVNRELGLLRSVLEAARLDWGWIKLNPMADVKRPKDPPSRKRRISDTEVEAVCSWLGYAGGKPANLSQRVAMAFLFALETGMRGGEIVALRWQHVKAKSVHLPKTKNGEARDVGLSMRARELLALLDGGDDPVFGLTDARKDALFRKGRTIPSLHFHDSRAEAIWRLSKKLDVLELARMVGHRNIGSLLKYYNASADELADKLG